MKSPYLFIFTLFTLFFLSLHVVFAISAVPADCSINRTLKIGMQGSEVACLQAKLGVTADGSFGPITQSAVISFQSGNPLVADGIFGPRSKAAFNAYNITAFYPVGCTSSTGYSTTTGVKCDGSASITVPSSVSVTNPTQGLPKVLSVSPEKVRSGDTVTISGQGFASTGNIVRLRYAQIEARFENLSSKDGKVISFVYQPAEIGAMSKQELLNLPSNTLKEITDPLNKAGGSLDDIIDPYRNMNNEDDLRQFLAKNGHSFDDLYDKFYVTVENMNGRGSSAGPILAGLRKLSFGSNLAKADQKSFFEKISSWLYFLEPEKAYAQVPEGGTNSGILFYCTCGPGYITTITDISSNGGSGFWWWPPGFTPNAGNSAIAGPQLGFFTPNAGICLMQSGLSCYVQPKVNLPNLPWGEGL
ncbi:MAG: peptidoglycan-binding protein [bacterium]